MPTAQAEQSEKDAAVHADEISMSTAQRAAAEKAAAAQTVKGAALQIEDISMPTAQKLLLRRPWQSKLRRVLPHNLSKFLSGCASAVPDFVFSGWLCCRASSFAFARLAALSRGRRGLPPCRSSHYRPARKALRRAAAAAGPYLGRAAATVGGVSRPRVTKTNKRCLPDVPSFILRR